LRQPLSLALPSVEAYFFHTGSEKQNRTSTDGYKMLGYVVIPREPLLERTISNQQGESQLPATNVIPNSRVIFLVVAFQTFCCMAITQTTALKDCNVFPAALSPFPTELPTHPDLGSRKVIRVVPPEVQVDGSCCPPHGASHGAHGSVQGWVSFPRNEKKGHFPHTSFCPQTGAQENTSESTKPSHVIPATEMVVRSIFQQQFTKALGRGLCSSQMLKRYGRTLLHTDKVENSIARHFVIQ